LVIIITLLFIIATAAAAYLYLQSNNTMQQAATTTSTNAAPQSGASPTEDPTATWQTITNKHELFTQNTTSVESNRTLLNHHLVGKQMRQAHRHRVSNVIGFGYRLKM
jgi:flagellar basal body-associated protein FliL